MTNAAIAIAPRQTDHTISFTLTLTLPRLPRRQKQIPSRGFSPERLAAAKEYFCVLRGPWPRI